jgi:hypothetical protein
MPKLQPRSAAIASTKGQPSPFASTLLTIKWSTLAGRKPKSAVANTIAYISAKFPKFLATAMGIKLVLDLYFCVEQGKKKKR